MAGDATFIPSSGNRGYSGNRTFPFKGTLVALTKARGMSI